jgi:hypothetical protein
MKHKQRLINLGFQKVGLWRLDQGNISYALDSNSNTDNLLYAFICEEAVTYIGKTTQTLNKRMKGYLKPGKTQSTNIKNNSNIASVLKGGKTVDIFILSDNGLLQYGGFHLNLAAGLEDSLISSVKPIWNDNGKNSKATVTSTCGQLSSSSAGQQSLSNHDLQFEISLCETNLKQGIINIPIRYSNKLRGDKEFIEIICGPNNEAIKGQINRTANTNSSPRIMGRIALADWFKNNFEIGQMLSVYVSSPQLIVLLKSIPKRSSC